MARGRLADSANFKYSETETTFVSGGTMLAGGGTMFGGILGRIVRGRLKSGLYSEVEEIRPRKAVWVSGIETAAVFGTNTSSLASSIASITLVLTFSCKLDSLLNRQLAFISEFFSVIRLCRFVLEVKEKHSENTLKVEMLTFLASFRLL